MNLSRLLHPRSVAVVGATERHGSYAAQTLINLDAAGYPEVWESIRARAGLRPALLCESERLPRTPGRRRGGHSRRRGGDGDRGGRRARLRRGGDLRGRVRGDAGRATAAGAPAAAGSDEAAAGAGYERAVREAALRHELPVCGPNANGIVALHERAALWGDALRPFEPGAWRSSPERQRLVNALNANRGLRLHTVVSCGNAVGLDPAAWVAQLAVEEGVGAIASTWSRTATARSWPRRWPGAPSTAWAWRS